MTFATPIAEPPAPLLRVLVANIPLPANRFLHDLNASLRSRCTLVHSSDAFWQMQGSFDIVHLHFPEYITYDMEAAYQRGLTETIIEQLEERLRFWSATSRLVVTRHNFAPHDAADSPLWARLYGMVYKYSDGVVHLAHASLDEFRDRYRATQFVRGHEPLHAVVQIHNYLSLPNDITRTEARRQLGIPDKARVMLVFGAIRNDAERDLILSSFEAARVPKKVLLVSHWREHLAPVSWIRLKYWLRDLGRLKERLNPRHIFSYGYVEESAAQTYLNSADILFIARIDTLSSANVAMGFTFGRVVVGPSSWNVGEMLRHAGNPTFDSSDAASVARAIEQGFELACEGVLGPANREHALFAWDVDTSAEQYIKFFRELTKALP